ncbi:MAG: MCE family protein [Sphingobacteriales bacterium]|jgi:phospholipid/cholesterol/gamma-HCH transport system substrate-binding protein|nr:MAG: MCE family protein [Sphingobacteriales bacterium]
MQENNKKAINVGIFIFIGLLIFVIGVFTLGSQKKAFNKSFSVNVVFNDIQGLKAGNNVWFSGVKIGTIKKIQFFGTSQVQVFMNLEEEAHKYIHKDAKALISSDGLIGNKIVVITGGNPKFPFVEEGDRLQVDPTLSTDDIMKTLQANNKNLITITNNLKILTNNMVQGKGTIGMLLTDSGMAQKVKSAISNLQTTTVNANKLSQQFAQFGAKLNTKGGIADKLLTDTSLFPRLKNSVASIQTSAKNAATFTNNLNTASQKLNSSDNTLGLLLNDKTSAQDLKATLSNLKTSTKKLDENMEALQHNFLLRGFFKKKAKEQAKLKDSVKP